MLLQAAGYLCLLTCLGVVTLQSCLAEASRTLLPRIYSGMDLRWGVLYQLRQYLKGEACCLWASVASLMAAHSQPCLLDSRQCPAEEATGKDVIIKRVCPQFDADLLFMEPSAWGAGVLVLSCGQPTQTVSCLPTCQALR